MRIRAPYFLAVGAISPRKNLTRLLAAWSRVARDMDGAVLVIVGQERLRFAASSMMDSPPAGVVHLTCVDDDELACLYSGAEDCYTRRFTKDSVCLSSKQWPVVPGADFGLHCHA